MISWNRPKPKPVKTKEVSKGHLKWLKKKQQRRRGKK